MGSLQVLLVSFVPGLLWLLHFYRKDSANPEPVPVVLRAFIFGVIMVIPAGVAEAPLHIFIQRQTSTLGFIFAMIVTVGLIEESAKYLALRLSTFSKTMVDEPVDGIVYGISAGLGFAAAENFLYAAAYGLEVGLVRAVVTCLVHASFTAIVGYAYGQSILNNYGHSAVVLAVVLAAVLHGLYNYLVVSRALDGGLLLVLVAGFYVYLAKAIDSRVEESRHEG